MVTRKLVYSVVCVVVMLGLAQMANAAVVKVVLEQTSGVTATYSGGTLNWTGGAAGFIMFDDLTIETFTDAYVLAETYGAVDQSSGGWADAVFTGGGSFSVTLAPGDLTGRSFSIVGDVSAYQETETGLGDELDGSGLLTSVVASFGTGWFGGTVTPLNWAGGSNALLDVDTALASGANFGSYATESYTTPNSTITLVTPEPTTIVLLGLGGLLLRRRRSA